MEMPFIQLLLALPRMSEVDAEPAFLHAPSNNPVSTMLLAYRTADHNFAVLAFDWEDGFYWRAEMPPRQMPDLEKYGLKPHAFHLVDNPDPAGPGGTVITFPHETYTIGGRGAAVLEQALDAASSFEAILVALRRHPHLFPKSRLAT